MFTKTTSYVRSKKVIVSTKKSFWKQTSERDTIIRKHEKEWDLIEEIQLDEDEVELYFEQEVENTKIRTWVKYIAGSLLLFLFVWGSVRSFITPRPSQGFSSSVNPTVVEISAGLSVVPTISQNLAVAATSTDLVVITSTYTTTPSPTSTKTPLPTATPTSTQVIGNTTGSNVNARSCPSTDCQVVDVVSSIDNLIILGEIDGWYFVSLPNDEPAYISSQLLELPDNAIVLSAPTLTPSPTIRATSRPTIAPTNRATNTSINSVGNEAEIQAYMAREILTYPGIGDGRFQDVYVTDTRQTIGELTLIVSYITKKIGNEEIILDTLDAFEILGTVLSYAENPYTFDNVALAVGDEQGEVIIIIGVSAANVADYAYSRLSTEDFISSW